MSDTQRLDWLERNPWRVLVCSEGNERYTFRLLLEADPARPTALNYSKEHYDTMREALDAGMKETL